MPNAKLQAWEERITAAPSSEDYQEFIDLLIESRIVSETAV